MHARLNSFLFFPFSSLVNIVAKQLKRDPEEFQNLQPLKTGIHAHPERENESIIIIMSPQSLLNLKFLYFLDKLKILLKKRTKPEHKNHKIQFREYGINMYPFMFIVLFSFVLVVS